MIRIIRQSYAETAVGVAEAPAETPATTPLQNQPLIPAEGVYMLSAVLIIAIVAIALMVLKKRS
jgi:hypothetical protein